MFWAGRVTLLSTIWRTAEKVCLPSRGESELGGIAGVVDGQVTLNKVSVIPKGERGVNFSSDECGPFISGNSYDMIGTLG